MSGATLILAFLAGVLTILSPCVLPLVPVVLASATTQHRLGPVALAAGVGLSFAAIGGVLASLGPILDPTGNGGALFQYAVAVALLIFGLVLIIPSLQTRLAMAAEPVGNWVNNRLGTLPGHGVSGQFILGLALGAVWTPCVGPTLGAASLLASQGQSLAIVSLTMLMFGLGTALALAALGMISRSVLIAWRGTMIGAGQMSRVVLGVGLFIVGGAILTGANRTIEAYLTQASPDWLTQLTTRF